MPKLFVTKKIRMTDTFRFWPTLLFLVALLAFIVLFCVFFTYPEKVHGKGLLLVKGEIRQVISPAQGTISSWRKEEGDVIRRGETVAFLIEHAHPDREKAIIAHVDGIIAEIIAYPDAQVQQGQALAVVTNHGDMKKDLEAVSFVSSLEGKKIAVGMKVLLDPSITHPYLHGYLIGEVKRVGKLPMSKEAIYSILKIPSLAHYIESQLVAEPFMVMVALKPDKDHVTGYEWSGVGPSFVLDSGVLLDLDVIVAESNMASLLWPSWRL